MQDVRGHSFDAAQVRSLPHALSGSLLLGLLLI